MVNTATQKQIRQSICEEALTGSDHTAPSSVRGEAL